MRPRAFRSAGRHAFMTDRIEWQNLQSAGSQDSSVVDEKIETPFRLGCDVVSPILNRGRVCNVTDCQRYHSTRRLVEVFDLLWRKGCPENAIVLGCKT